MAEDLLVRSEGYLPEEGVQQSSRRRSITLPTLRRPQGNLELSEIFNDKIDQVVW